MKKVALFFGAVLLAFNVHAAEINAQGLNLSEEQNQKIIELKEKLKAEVDPIWEEIQRGRDRITEIERHYFEEFWNTLTEEQKEAFSKANQQ